LVPDLEHGACQRPSAAKNPSPDAKASIGIPTEIKMIQRTLSRAALEADKAFKPAEPETTEYARTQQAFQDNRERLKMERLAREATVKR
jgi:hypothetical protein